MKTKLTLSLLSVATAAALFTGCASSTNTAKKSGFLGDYTELKEGGKDEAQYYYVNEDVDFTKYTKVKFAPVTVWRMDNDGLDTVDEAEAKELADDLFKSIHTALMNDYEVAHANGPDVMLIRVALTQATGANQVMNSVSTVVPVGLVVSAGKKLVTGSHAFVASAAIEVEILDSATGTRLAAAVDERTGSKGFEDEWTQVEKAFDYWAAKLQERLEKLNNDSK